MARSPQAHHGVYIQRDSRRTITFPLQVLVTEPDVQMRDYTSPSAITIIVMFRRLQLGGVSKGSAWLRPHALPLQDFLKLYRYEGKLTSTITRKESVVGKGQGRR